MRQWWLRPRSADALALVAGAALPFAFSPFKIWPLALLSPALWFLVWMRDGGARAVWRGWLFGFGSFGVGVSWILASFKFAEVALPLAVLLTVGFIAFLSLYPAFAGFVLQRMILGRGAADGQRPVVTGFHYLVVLPAGLVFTEWLRGWLLSGFGWLQLGYSQVDGPLRGLLPIFGVYGVSLAIAVLAGALAWLLVERNRESLLGCVGLVLLIGGVAGGFRDQAWTRVAGEPLKVAVIQGNIPQDQKWLARMRQPTLERYLNLTRQHWDARLIVWPETALPGTPQTLAAFLEQLKQMAAARGASVLYGILEFDPTTRQAFNSTFLTGVDQGRYRKRHLVPFGEYLPLNSLLRPLVRALEIPVSNFSPGAPVQPLLRVGNLPVAMFICYEIAFGQAVAAALPQARLLATVSNDAWFGDSFGPHQHLQIARARAIETGRYLIRATNTGLSAVVDPRGRIVARSPQFEVAALSTEVWPMAGSTPYVIWGDWPVLGVVVVMLLVGVGVVWRRPHPGRLRHRVR